MKHEWKSLFAIIALAGASLTAQHSFGHGEDKPGPHGGAIRMPGAFHTELKQQGPSSFLVYLLDLHWKNPVTRNTELKVVLKRGATESELSCKASGKSYRCVLPKGMKFLAGDEFVVTARREAAQGIPMTYAHPFAPLKANPDDHSSHHH